MAETRSIHLTIAPATETTCGDGEGAFCPWVRATHLGAEYFCWLWGTLQDKKGWLQRHAECLANEAEKIIQRDDRIAKVEAERDEARSALQKIGSEYHWSDSPAGNIARNALNKT